MKRGKSVCKAPKTILERALSVWQSAVKAVAVAGLVVGMLSASVCTVAANSAENGCRTDSVAVPKTETQRATGEDLKGKVWVCRTEQMPSFKGNINAWLADNIRYPEALAESCVQGRVIVTFVVEEDGSISSPVVVRSLDPLLDAEALRVVGIMPKWKPGLRNGKPVRVRFTLPVTFKIE